MIKHAAQFSPRLYAGTAGVLYLYIMIAGSFAQIFVRGSFIASADAEATAANITANETLFRLGFSGELLHLAFDVIIAVLLYALFRSVDRNIALLAAFMRFACDIILAAASISHFAALKVLADADYLNTFSPEQLHTISLISMKLHGDAYAISLVFFSFACFALGYLIYISRYIPRTIGILLITAGISYIIICFTHFLNPGLSAVISQPLFIPVFIAELSLTLWLIIKGINLEAWNRHNPAPAA